MKNPPNGTAPKSFDTNKRKRLFLGQQKTFGHHRMGKIEKKLFDVKSLVATA